MQKIQHTTASDAKPTYTSTGTVGFFREGEAGGDPPTYVTADWLNLIQEEIVSVIDAASIELDEADDTQLLQAITALIDARLAALATHPVGSIMMRAVDSVTSGWLKCDGSAIGREAYAALFAVIGTTFGGGDGSTTFNIPDLRGYFPRCHDARVGGRSFGSTQADGVYLPALTCTVDSGGAHSATLTSSEVTLTHGTVTVSSAGAVAEQTLTAQATSHQHTFGIPAETPAHATPHTHQIHYEHVNVASGSGMSVIRNIGNYGQSSNTDPNNPSSAGNHGHSGTTNAEAAHTHPVSVPAIDAHTHTATVAAHAAHSHTVALSVPAHTHTATVTGSGATETRPKNITLAFMIRAV